VKLDDGGPRKCSENVYQHQHSMFMLNVFSINSLCFLSTFGLKRIISNGKLWSGG